MIPEEAAWIRNVVERYRPERILDCGSSSQAYRRESQPHIDRLFAGFDVTHLDIAAGPGVDMVADICSADDLPRFPMVVCASLLEHVQSVERAIQNVCRAVGGHLVVTAPNRWPGHGGYDNGYRPSVAALCLAVEELGLTAQRAELLHAGGPYAGRRVVAVHAVRE